MLSVDLRGNSARLSLAEIISGGERYVSSPAAFAAFAMGLRLEPWLLAEGLGGQGAGAAAGFTYFRALMHGVVPRIYDVRHLERLGGRFALRIADLGGRGDFTVIAMNRRVLTLSGLPHDAATGRPVIDAEIHAGAFLAFCNDLLAELAEGTLRRIAERRIAQPNAT